MTAAERVLSAYRRVAEVDRPEVWIALRTRDEALADALRVDAEVAAGEHRPLAGSMLAVKDNIDVAGLPTTAGCPAFAYSPEADAPAVARLKAAGAVVLGKTNLDQFATGLVGTRSPYGAVRDARRPNHASGGSSSGSGVAVALGIADLALGTDTAGSGRVPAAFGGIVAIKPTRGLVPTLGVVPACRTLDCVSVFARDLSLAERAMGVLQGAAPGDPTARPWPSAAPLGAPPSPRVAIPADGQLHELTGEGKEAFAGAVQRMAAAGARLVEIDLTPFLEAGRLLYAGAYVAERYAAVGPFVDAHPEDVDPTVGAIIAAARAVPAHALVADGESLDRLRLAAESALAGVDALLLPTAPKQPTLAEVAADPVGVNSRLGVWTTFCNLLDLCAVSVPAGEADGGRFGVSVLARAFADRVAAEVAALLTGEGSGDPGWGPPGVDLFVVGAHRSGQRLNAELAGRGARLVATEHTAPGYRLFRLDTTPPKPGLVRVTEGGAAIEGERWRLPPSLLGDLLAALPPPMVLGPIRLAGGATSVGFLCETLAIEGAEEITAHGSWPAYLERS